MSDRRAFLLGSVAAIGMSPFNAAFAARKFGPRKVATHSVLTQGLDSAIEIVDDVYGVPHVRARSIPDAFFGQGYVVARDRLFQIDLGYRRELGRMAEAYGPEFVAHDENARLFYFQGDLEAELRRIPKDVRDCALAYVAGVNARIDELAADPSLLPQEYGILGVQPLRWDLRNLVLGRGDTIRDADDELRRAMLAAMDLLDLDAVVAPLSPAWTMAVPAGLDTAAVSEADLGVLRSARLPFGPDTPVVPSEEANARSNAGSNAWTVSPSRTATGRAILANDPHLGIGGFGPRHVVHLSAPGLDVIGGGAPGLPGIMQGHTDHFAFGRTNSHIDQQDMFILELHPDDPERYRHGRRWKRFRRVESLIPVKGAAPHRFTSRYAVQGPVVAHDASCRRATAISSIGLRSGGSGIFAMIAINLSQDWNSLKTAFRLHPSPTNFHYADVDGNTGWQVIGFMPVRKSGDGLFPVPGDGRYDWTGQRNFSAMPSEYNPAKGWFASANQNNLPDGWPSDRIPAFSFRPPYRYDRIVDVLSRQDRHSVAHSVALIHDTLSLPALQVIKLLPDNPSRAAAPAVQMLSQWDGRMNADSPTAALFQSLWRELSEGMLAAIVPEGAQSLVTEIAPSVVLDLLAAPDSRLGTDPKAGCRAIFEAALSTAWAKTREALGSDPTLWRWDKLHQVRTQHPLSNIPAIAKAFPAIEGRGTGGDSYTVMARWVGNGPSWRVTGGASYFQVIDVGAWDNSMMLNLPGQSNDPRSPHYGDLYDVWISGEAKPMLFSSAAVDLHAAVRTTIVPMAKELQK